MRIDHLRGREAATLSSRRTGQSSPAEIQPVPSRPCMLAEAAHVISGCRAAQRLHGNRSARVHVIERTPQGGDQRSGHGASVTDECARALRERVKSPIARLADSFLFRWSPTTQSPAPRLFSSERADDRIRPGTTSWRTSRSTPRPGARTMRCVRSNSRPFTTRMPRGGRNRVRL